MKKKDHHAIRVSLISCTSMIYERETWREGHNKSNQKSASL